MIYLLCHVLILILIPLYTYMYTCTYAKRNKIYDTIYVYQLIPIILWYVIYYRINNTISCCARSTYTQEESLRIRVRMYSVLFKYCAFTISPCQFESPIPRYNIHVYGVTKIMISVYYIIHFFPPSRPLQRSLTYL